MSRKIRFFAESKSHRRKIKKSYCNSVAYEGPIKSTTPPNGAKVSSPVKVCMEVHGVEVNQLKKELTLEKDITTSLLTLIFLAI